MGNGYIIEWNGCKAYVGETGKVEGVDGDMWPMGKSIYMLKKMLSHRKIKYKECECIVSLCGPCNEPKPKKRKVKLETNEPEQCAYPKEPECKS